MIVRDEERFLDGALESMRGVADEICVVDTGSTDASIEIAQRRGARVQSVAWRDDFAWARNVSLEMATRRWIFVLDADERLMPSSRTLVQHIGGSPAALRGAWVRARNLNDDYRGSGAMSNALVRLFPNDPRIRYRNAIHEFVTLDDGEGGLDAAMTSIEIEHHGYLADVVTDRRKGERNLRLSRAAAERAPNDPYHQYNLGMAAILAGDRRLAIASLAAMVRLTDGSRRGFRPHGLVTLADLYLSDGNVATALETVDVAIRETPNNPNAHFVRGRIFALDGRLYEARDAFGAAIAAGESSQEQFVVDEEIARWKAHSEIGATLMREERFEEALRWFELALRVRPDAEPLLINRAKTLEALGDRSAALQAFRAAFDTHASELAGVQYINALLRHGEPHQALAIADQIAPALAGEAAIRVLGTAVAVASAVGDEPRAKRYLRAALAAGGDAGAETLRDLYGSLTEGEAALKLLREERASHTLNEQ